MLATSLVLGKPVGFCVPSQGWTPQICAVATGLCMPHAKSLQLYLTLCNSMSCSLAGISVHGILQARMLEWIAMFTDPKFCWVGENSGQKV